MSAEHTPTPLALELRRFYTNSILKPVGLGARHPELYTDEALTIRKLLSAETVGQKYPTDSDGGAEGGGRCRHKLKLSRT